VGRDHERGADLARGVRAAVDQRIRLVREEPSVFGNRGAECDDRGVARVGGLQFVDVVHDGFDRSTGRARHEVTGVFVDGQALAAEVAADECRVDDDLSFGQLQRGGELLTQRGWRLVGADDAHALLFVDPDDARARLDEALELARGRESVLEDVRRARKDSVDLLARLALLDQAVAVHVGMRRGRAFGAQERVRVDVRMEDRRVRLDGILRAEDAWQCFVLHLDEARGSFGAVLALGGDGGDAIADHPHAVGGEHGPVLQPSADTRGADIRSGQDGMDARRLLRGVGGDGDDARVRMRTPRIRQVQHTRQLHVGGVARAAGDFERALDAVLRFGEQLLGHSRLRSARSVHTRAIWRL
jgi:hypothetical protein